MNSNPVQDEALVIIYLSLMALALPLLRKKNKTKPTQTNHQKLTEIMWSIHLSLFLISAASDQLAFLIRPLN